MSLIITVDGKRPEWLTGAEVAQVLRVDEGTVRRWARTGKLTAHRMAGHRRYLRTDVEAILRRRS
jgi:excisionase family DNA binding protein